MGVFEVECGLPGLEINSASLPIRIQTAKLMNAPALDCATRKGNQIIVNHAAGELEVTVQNDPVGDQCAALHSVNAEHEKSVSDAVRSASLSKSATCVDNPRSAQQSATQRISALHDWPPVLLPPEQFEAARDMNAP